MRAGVYSKQLLRKAHAQGKLADYHAVRYIPTVRLSCGDLNLARDSFPGLPGKSARARTH